MRARGAGFTKLSVGESIANLEKIANNSKAFPSTIGNANFYLGLLMLEKSDHKEEAKVFFKRAVDNLYISDHMRAYAVTEYGMLCFGYDLHSAVHELMNGLKITKLKTEIGETIYHFMMEKEIKLVMGK